MDANIYSCLMHVMLIRLISVKVALDNQTTTERFFRTPWFLMIACKLSFNGQAIIFLLGVETH